MAAMVLLYAAARTGLQFGHARIEYQEHGSHTSATRLISDVAVAVLIAALLRLTQALKRISEGDLFGVQVVRLLRSFALWLFVMSMIELVGPTLGQLLDASAAGGVHQLRIAIDSRDVLFVGVTVLLLLLVRLLERARALDEEMREIV